MKRKVLLGLVALFGNVPLAAVAADCGPEFNGKWILAERYDGNQFGYYQFEYNFDRSTRRANWIKYDAKTLVGGYPLGSGMPGRKGVIILHLMNGQHHGNLAVSTLGEGKCELNFTGPPRVPVDKYGVASRDVSQKAQLTLNGSALRYCWVESGHMLGQCNTYKKGDR